MSEPSGIENRRVVVTGIGSVAPCGIGARSLLDVMERPRSCVRRLTRFDASAFTSRIAGEIDGFNPPPGGGPGEVDRGVRFALAASREALEDAGLLAGRSAELRIETCLGAAAGCVEYYEDRLFRAARNDATAFPPSFYGSVTAASASMAVARRLGLTGRATCVSTSCVSGTDAVGCAFHRIRSGRADVVLAGGADAPIAPVTYGCFTVIRSMSTRNDAPERASRPFDRDRDGFVLSEGAAAVVLEELGHALRRGARIYMEVAGYGTTLNAHHMTAPRPDGAEMARAIALALRDARMEPEGIDYVSAHGSSTPLNEPAETRALKIAFGGHARRLCVSSLKSMLGHTFGAAGGHQAVAAALMFERDLIPPTVNLDDPDPACDLDCVPWTPRRRRIRAVLHNACGFCGKNAAVVYRRLGSVAA